MAVKIHKLTDEEKNELAQSQRQALRARAVAAYTEQGPPQFTGFEDDTTRSLLLALHALRTSGLPSLSPLLPALLRLKGKPYQLHNYFPFEPFFRTRVARTSLLKTGRQVSKCLRADELVWTPSGAKPMSAIRVGDTVLAWNEEAKQFADARVTRVWDSGVQECYEVSSDNTTQYATSQHRFFVRDADIHTENYRRVTDIYSGDYIAARSPSSQLVWNRVRTVRPVGRFETRDIEVTPHHNFVLANGTVSHNSTSLAAQGIVFGNSIPYLAALYVTPLFEMIRRFSHNYVRAFIEESPVRELFISSKTTNQILQRSFNNGSSMYFSYAFLDAERTRGIPADVNVIDEIQDMNYDFLQIIHETLSGSPYGLRRYAGTPKSLDNTIQKLWEDSSQAEWVTRCTTGGCNHWNIASADYDLFDMMGDWHRDISEKTPAVVCSQCRKPLDPRRNGHWEHRYRDRRWTFCGHHVPQQIMPMHYANQEKWSDLIGKSKGRNNTTPTTFMNEVCGESCDTGSKLVTVSELKAACVLPWANRASEAKKHLDHYVRRILSIDWGGGGGKVKGGGANKGGDQKRERTSFTTYSVLGATPQGKIDVLWGYRSVRTHDWLYEANIGLKALQEFRCSHLIHDYSGAGEGRLVYLYQSGFNPANIINVRYQGFGHSIINFHPKTEDHPHDWWSLDKSRSIATVCLAIKHQLIRFFKYDYESADNPGLLEDFLALIEEKVNSRLGSDSFVIVRNPNKPDDFVQSVNMGTCVLWHMLRMWPNIAEAARFIVPPAVHANTRPLTTIDWEDI